MSEDADQIVRFVITDAPSRAANSMLQEVCSLNPSQPVIVLSGKGTSKKEDCACMLGASEVIEKRVAPRSLVKILGRMINHRRSERAPIMHLNNGGCF